MSKAQELLDKTRKIEESLGAYSKAIDAVADMPPNVIAMAKAYADLASKGMDETEAFEQAFTRLSGTAYVEAKRAIAEAGAYSGE